MSDIKIILRGNDRRIMVDGKVLKDVISVELLRFSGWREIPVVRVELLAVDLEIDVDGKLECAGRKVPA